MKLTVEQMEIIYRAGGNNADIGKIEREECEVDWDMARVGMLPLELLPADTVALIRRMAVSEG